MLRKFKKNDYTDLKAYRLIALLNTIKKALKLVVVREINRRYEDEPLVTRVLNKRETRTFHRNGIKTFSRASVYYIKYKN